MPGREDLLVTTTSIHVGDSGILMFLQQNLSNTFVTAIYNSWGDISIAS